MATESPRTGRRLGAGAAVLAAGALLAGGGGAALAATRGETARPSADGTGQAHVTGDAWVRYSVDAGNPLRRFVFDAHGNPFKVVDGKLVMGDAYGTVRFNHPAEDPDGVVRDHWGSVDVDYVMTGGPVAVVSGISTGPDRQRMTFTVYDDPRGRRFDRVGFSWGAVDGRCHRMGMAPAPFTSYASGKGYTVRHAELPTVPVGTRPPDDPPACTGE